MSGITTSLTTRSKGCALEPPQRLQAEVATLPCSPGAQELAQRLADAEVVVDDQDVKPAIEGAGRCRCSAAAARARSALRRRSVISAPGKVLAGLVLGAARHLAERPTICVDSATSRWTASKRSTSMTSLLVARRPATNVSSSSMVLVMTSRGLLISCARLTASSPRVTSRSRWRIWRRSFAKPIEPTSSPCSSRVIEPEMATGMRSPSLATKTVSQFLTVPRRARVPAPHRPHHLAGGSSRLGIEQGDGLSRGPRPRCSRGSAGPRRCRRRSSPAGRRRRRCRGSSRGAFRSRSPAGAGRRT